MRSRNCRRSPWRLHVEGVTQPRPDADFVDVTAHISAPEKTTGEVPQSPRPYRSVTDPSTAPCSLQQETSPAKDKLVYTMVIPPWHSLRITRGTHVLQARVSRLLCVACCSMLSL